jgi:hypothetical protein
MSPDVARSFLARGYHVQHPYCKGFGTDSKGRTCWVVHREWELWDALDSDREFRSGNWSLCQGEWPAYPDLASWYFDQLSFMRKVPSGWQLEVADVNSGLWTIRHDVKKGGVFLGDPAHMPQKITDAPAEYDDGIRIGLRTFHKMAKPGVYIGPRHMTALQREINKVNRG